MSVGALLGNLLPVTRLNIGDNPVRLVTGDPGSLARALQEPEERQRLLDDLNKSLAEEGSAARAVFAHSLLLARPQRHGFVIALVPSGGDKVDTSRTLEHFVPGMRTIHIDPLLGQATCQLPIAADQAGTVVKRIKQEQRAKEVAAITDGRQALLPQSFLGAIGDLRRIVAAEECPHRKLLFQMLAEATDYATLSLDDLAAKYDDTAGWDEHFPARRVGHIVELLDGVSAILGVSVSMSVHLP